jgi:hypothetical protein
MFSRHETKGKSFFFSGGYDGYVGGPVTPVALWVVIGDWIRT